MTIQKPKTSSRRRRCAAGPHRPSFTLVELLMVVAIISVLMLLTVRVIGAFIGQAKASATETTIRKIQSLLNSRSEALYRMLRRPNYLANSDEYFSPEVMQLSLAVVSSVPVPGGNLPVREIVATKQITRKYFPQRAAEVNTSLQPNFATADPTKVTSAAILYDFLTQANVLGGQSPGIDAFTAAEARDGDIPGLPEFVDAWGNRLRFYRWPTKLFRPSPGYPVPPNLAANTPGDPTNGIAPQNAQVLFSTLPIDTNTLLSDLARDPDDPLRQLNMPGLSFTNFENPGTGSLFHTPVTYHVLLVISAGPDGRLGLYEPEDTANFGHLAAVRDVNDLADDITYLNTRAGGK
jgi:type II secretory pathway pseudopilin PulG